MSTITYTAKDGSTSVLNNVSSHCDDSGFSRVFLVGGDWIASIPRGKDVPDKEVLCALQHLNSPHIPKCELLGTSKHGKVYKMPKYNDYWYSNIPIPTSQVDEMTVILDAQEFAQGFTNGGFRTPTQAGDFVVYLREYANDNTPVINAAIAIIEQAMESDRVVRLDIRDDNVMLDDSGNIILLDLFWVQSVETEY